MLRQDSMAVVPPPNTHTVKKTMSRVVLNIICRAYVAVSRMARAKAMAPRSPAGRDSRGAVSARAQATPMASFPSGIYTLLPLCWDIHHQGRTVMILSPLFPSPEGEQSSCPMPCIQSRTGGAHSYISNHWDPSCPASPPDIAHKRLRVE